MYLEPSRLLAQLAHGKYCTTDGLCFCSLPAGLGAVGVPVLLLFLERVAASVHLRVVSLQSRRLYRELMRENAQLQERRKLLQAQQVAEEAAASACAAKLLGREEMIRKRREEVRALALERSQRLTAQGAAALAAAMVSIRSLMWLHLLQ